MRIQMERAPAPTATDAHVTPPRLGRPITRGDDDTDFVCFACGEVIIQAVTEGHFSQIFSEDRDATSPGRLIIDCPHCGESNCPPSN